MLLTPEAGASSITKALYLLSLFTTEPYEFGVKEVVDITGYNRTTVYRILTELEDSSMIIKDGNKKTYKMGPMAYHFGSFYLYNKNYKEGINTLLEKISEETKETLGMAYRDENSVVSIFAVEKHQSLKINEKPGAFYPMNKGCYGKCLMAYHDEKTVRKMLSEKSFIKTASKTLVDTNEILKEYKKIRENGYVTSIDEVADYVCGVGVPLEDKNGEVKNVIAVSFLKQDNYEKRIKEILQTLLKYKKELEMHLFVDFV